MGVRISHTPEPMDRCHLSIDRNMEDEPEIGVRSFMVVGRWAEYVNLWCPRSSLGRRSCKRSGCCAQLPLLEEMEG